MQLLSIYSNPIIVIIRYPWIKGFLVLEFFFFPLIICKPLLSSKTRIHRLVNLRNILLVWENKIFMRTLAIDFCMRRITYVALTYLLYQWMMQLASFCAVRNYKYQTVKSYLKNCIVYIRTSNLLWKCNCCVVVLKAWL